MLELVLGLVIFSLVFFVPYVIGAPVMRFVFPENEDNSTFIRWGMGLLFILISLNALYVIGVLLVGSFDLAHKVLVVFGWGG